MATSTPIQAQSEAIAKKVKEALEVLRKRGRDSLQSTPPCPLTVPPPRGPFLEFPVWDARHWGEGYTTTVRCLVPGIYAAFANTIGDPILGDVCRYVLQRGEDLSTRKVLDIFHYRGGTGAVNLGTVSFARFYHSPETFDKPLSYGRLLHIVDREKQAKEKPKKPRQEKTKENAPLEKRLTLAVVGGQLGGMPAGTPLPTPRPNKPAPVVIVIKDEPAADPTPPQPWIERPRHKRMKTMVDLRDDDGKNAPPKPATADIVYDPDMPPLEPFD
jgi:hypothetical protein